MLFGLCISIGKVAPEGSLTGKGQFTEFTSILTWLFESLSKIETICQEKKRKTLKTYKYFVPFSFQVYMYTFKFNVSARLDHRFRVILGRSQLVVNITPTLKVIQ